MNDEIIESKAPEILGKIISIEEVKDGTDGAILDMDGYIITTDLHKFSVLIDNGQCCCESWGYVSSEEDHAPFIGAELREVNLTDTALNTQIFESSGSFGDEDNDEGGVQFVSFVTDRGVFQLAVYNEHNGYYGHSISITKDDDTILDSSL